MLDNALVAEEAGQFRGIEVVSLTEPSAASVIERDVLRVLDR